jgi:hypothetical protein
VQRKRSAESRSTPYLSQHGGCPTTQGGTLADLLEELEHLLKQQKRILSMVDNGVSRLQKVFKQSTPRSLAESEELVRWADSAGACGPHDDTRRPRKRARGGS